jgi:hypothetical protein
MSKVGVERLPMYDNDGDLIEEIERATTPNRFITKLVLCFWCFTTWISLAITIVYGLLMDMNIGQLLLVWLASAGLSGWLFERIPYGKSE